MMRSRWLFQSLMPKPNKLAGNYELQSEAQNPRAMLWHGKAANTVQSSHIQRW